MNDTLVEVMARAAHLVFRKGIDRWDKLNEAVKDSFRAEQRAALDAAVRAGLITIRERETA